MPRRKDPEPSAEVQENSFDDFYERFLALQLEGLKFGISSAFVLYEHDLLKVDERYACNCVGLRVPLVHCVGELREHILDTIYEEQQR